MSFANWIVIFQTKKKKDAGQIIRELESRGIPAVLKFHDPWYFLGYFFGKSQYHVLIPLYSKSIARQILQGKESSTTDFSNAELI